MTTYRPSKFVRRKYPKIDNTEPTYTMMSKELARITLFLYNKGVEEQTLINSRYEDRYRAYKWELPHDELFHIMYRGAYARLNGITGLPATAPISPKPRTAVPSVITATKLPLLVYW